MAAPCKNCSNKGCGAYHGQCEAYLAFQEKQREAYKVRVMNVHNSRKGGKTPR